MKQLLQILHLALLCIIPLMTQAQTDTSVIFAPEDSIRPDDSGLAYDSVQPVTDDLIVPEAEPPRLEWNGYLMTDDRVRFEGGRLNWQEYRVDLKGSYRFSDRTRFYAETWLRGIKTPGITQTKDLMFSNKVMPVEIDLREAWFDIYGLFTKNLDVRIGRQRIAWGTGDRLNPTDNLNPYDLEDIWDFGRHTASNAIQLNYYLKKWTFTAVGILNFSPAILPGSDWTPAFMPESTLPAVFYDSTFLPGVVVPVYITTDAVHDSIILPERNLKSSPSFGAKIKRSLGNWDLSLSYIYNRETLPVPVKAHTDLTIDSLGLNLPLEVYAMAHATVDAQLIYPRRQIIGFDFAGSLWGIGLRGEAACFFPEKTILSRTMRYSVQFPPLIEFTRDSILPDSVISDGDPYVKFLLGFDYTFRHNFYLNFQYLHGFIHETGMKNLTDYFVLGLEWTTPNGRLKLAPLNGAIQIGDWKNISEAWALMYMPEIKYCPVDNTEISVGAHLISGEGATGFSKVNKNDDLYIKFKYSF